ncbi:acyltransferase family protein [Intestinibacter sp.]
MNKKHGTLQYEHINSIDYIKLICAFLVVAIHTHPFEEYNKVLFYLCTEVIPRIAVPFFFTVSGYFYLKALNLKKDIFRNYMKRLLQSYVIWTIIYILVRLITLSQDYTIKGFIMDTIIMFFYLGSYYHLWYFVALIICVLIVTFFNKYNKLQFLYVISILLYFIGLLGTSYYKFGMKIPVLSNLYRISYFTEIRRYFMMGLPFFMLGYLLNKIKTFKHIKKILLLNIILFVIEIIIVNKFGLQNSIVISVFLYPLVATIFLTCVKNPMMNYGRYANISRLLSSFIYYIHPIIILLISNLKLSQTFTYLLTCFVSTALGLLIIKIDNKYINKLL